MLSISDRENALMKNRPQPQMIVNCLINRVDVCRGYKLHIDFNFDYRQFPAGLDSVEAA